MLALAAGQHGDGKALDSLREVAFGKPDDPMEDLDLPAIAEVLKVPLEQLVKVMEDNPGWMPPVIVRK